MPFIYIKIPSAASKNGRDLACVDAIDEALRERNLGSVIGWGDSLGDLRPDGSRPVAFLRIDIEIADLASGRAALRQMLPGLGVSTGSEIHYRGEQSSLQDIYTPSGWQLEQPIARANK